MLIECFVIIMIAPRPPANNNNISVAQMCLMLLLFKISEDIML